jgi:hypothetical protein
MSARGKKLECESSAGERLDTVRLQLVLLLMIQSHRLTIDDGRTRRVKPAENSEGLIHVEGGGAAARFRC